MEKVTLPFWIFRGHIVKYSLYNTMLRLILLYWTRCAYFFVSPYAKGDCMFGGKEIIRI